MSEAVWILGIHMTKFGKHPDLDTVDLASEAALGALADARVTMKVGQGRRVRLRHGRGGREALGRWPAGRRQPG
jgi:hypothetical protein